MPASTPPKDSTQKRKGTRRLAKSTALSWSWKRPNPLYVFSRRGAPPPNTLPSQLSLPSLSSAGERDRDAGALNPQLRLRTRYFLIPLFFGMRPTHDSRSSGKNPGGNRETRAPTLVRARQYRLAAKRRDVGLLPRHRHIWRTAPFTGRAVPYTKSLQSQLVNHGIKLSYYRDAHRKLARQRDVGRDHGSMHSVNASAMSLTRFSRRFVLEVDVGIGKVNVCSGKCEAEPGIWDSGSGAWRLPERIEGGEHGCLLLRVQGRRRPLEIALHHERVGKSGGEELGRAFYVARGEGVAEECADSTNELHSVAGVFAGVATTDRWRVAMGKSTGVGVVRSMVEDVGPTVFALWVETRVVERLYRFGAVFDGGDEGKGNITHPISSRFIKPNSPTLARTGPIRLPLFFLPSHPNTEKELEVSNGPVRLSSGSIVFEMEKAPALVGGVDPDQITVPGGYGRAGFCWIVPIGPPPNLDLNLDLTTTDEDKLEMYSRAPPGLRRIPRLRRSIPPEIFSNAPSLSLVVELVPRQRQQSSIDTLASLYKPATMRIFLFCPPSSDPSSSALYTTASSPTYNAMSANNYSLLDTGALPSANTTFNFVTWYLVYADRFLLSTTMFSKNPPPQLAPTGDGCGILLSRIPSASCEPTVPRQGRAYGGVEICGAGVLRDPLWRVWVVRDRSAAFARSAS
ncbi:hypothetical protein C8R46DRAFT_1197449 [Mycena filopes]|nr:hypothetical protein C8R46DRAFT_1197449 [Mycena filopes]